MNRIIVIKSSVIINVWNGNPVIKNRLNKIATKKGEKKNRGISKEKQVIETFVGDGLKNL